MKQTDFGALLAMLDDGRADVENVGAFWHQARRTRVAGAKQPVAVIPVTFHLVGDLRSVAYAQLLAGPGLKEAYKHTPNICLVWYQRSGKMPPLALAEYALPMLGLFWTATPQTVALDLGRRLLEILASEFPNPEWELEQSFGMSLDRLFDHLAETEFLQAGSTLRSTER